MHRHIGTWCVVSNFCKLKRDESADKLVQSPRIYIVYALLLYISHPGDVNYASDRPRRLTPKLVPFGGVMAQ